MKWEELRPDQMAEAIERSGGLCVFPLGCTEKHGPHMPLGTDSLQVRHHVELAAEMEDVVVFPTAMWLGDMMDNHPFDYQKANHGCITLSPHTLLTVLEELCDEIARNGFRKILIVNGHGGNRPLLSYFLRCQCYGRKPYATMTADSWDGVISHADQALAHFTAHREDYPMLTEEDFALLKQYADLPEGFGKGGHAGLMETAWSMGAHPHLLSTDRVEVGEGLSTHRADYLSELGISIACGWQANFPNAIGGHSCFGCTETLGQAFNRYSALKIAKMIRVLKQDEECIQIATGK